MARLNLPASKLVTNMRRKRSPEETDEPMTPREKKTTFNRQIPAVLLLTSSQHKVPAQYPHSG